MKGNTLDEVSDVLENPTYLEVLLCILTGRNYATAIARCLKKKQPTVTEQLKVLERHNLIKPLKRGKSQRYEVNLRVLLDIFYDIIGQVLNIRREFIKKRELKKIEKTELDKIIPPELITNFLKEYFETFLEMGGKRKGFDEIIFSFFCAINNLEDSYRRKLVKKFNIDGKLLEPIANLMELEMSGLEEAALIVCLETTKEDEEDG